jgi:hypothetical protein
MSRISVVMPYSPAYESGNFSDICVERDCHVAGFENMRQIGSFAANRYSRNQIRDLQSSGFPSSLLLMTLILRCDHDLHILFILNANGFSPGGSGHWLLYLYGHISKKYERCQGESFVRFVRWQVSKPASYQLPIIK